MAKLSSLLCRACGWASADSMGICGADCLDIGLPGRVVIRRALVRDVKAKTGVVDMTRLRQNDGHAIIEAIVAAVRCNGDDIVRLRPCKLTIHVPPERCNDPPVVEIQAKLKGEPEG